jgi:hypothetical protein
LNILRPSDNISTLKDLSRSYLRVKLAKGFQVTLGFVVDIHNNFMPRKYPT